jgi:predicted permease
LDALSPAERARDADYRAASAGYFSAMGIPLIRGRFFRESDGPDSPQVAIVSQSLVKRYWPNQDPIGKQIQFGNMDGDLHPMTVVGVVGDVRDSDLATPPSATVYVPQVVPIDPTTEPSARRTMALVVRTSGPPAAVVAAVRRVVRDLDPTVPIFNVETMSDVVRASTSRLSLALTLMTAAAAITLLLGTIGLYGVMAYTVALRTREFGVRVALGASPRQLAQSVAMRGLALTASGVAGGFVLYAIAAPFLRAFLYGVTPSDPLTLAGAALVLVATASLASWFPARRAARVDPAEALRAE